MIMDGLPAEYMGECAAARRKGDEVSWSSSHVRAQHRRSKSASDRNSEVPGSGASCSTKKDLRETKVAPLSTWLCTARSPFHDKPTSFENCSLNHRTSLEKDVELLQMRLQQEKSMRSVLERAMGRASSALSPGHRHFATQTKELISEIELLEEEVANREQHILSLYRSIFENSVSRGPSQQSSVTASPAHQKHASRKHPSIISSAFCSSKKFPLRHLHAFVSANELGKSHSRSNDRQLFRGKHNILFDTTCSGPFKAREKAQMTGRTPLRTLKEHLYQCPSKLSEEMVRCMAAIYCWLRCTTSRSPQKNRAPLLLRSSTKVLMNRHGIGEDQESSCKSMLAISWLSTERCRVPHASYAINSYRALVEQLEKVDVCQMGNNAQLAFWINVYNALVMHAYLAYGIPSSSLRRLALFHKAVYSIGGHIVSANAIEQSVFGFRSPRTGRWLETFLSAALRKKSAEERQLVSSKFGLPYPQPLACFALCTGASSDPMLKVYTAAKVEEELETAKKDFLQGNVVVKKSRKVLLPKLLERFGKEASITSDELLHWISENVETKLRESVQECLNHKSSKRLSQTIEWSSYSTRFCYVFAKDITEKSWWKSSKLSSSNSITEQLS